MKMKSVAKAAAVVALIGEGAFADYALYQLLNNGVEIEVTSAELKRAGRAVRDELAKEGEPMLDESVVGED